MHFLGFWLIVQLLFVGASSKETTMTYIVFSKLSNSRICIICIYIPKFTNVNIIMYHFFSIINSHSFFNSIQLSTRRGSRLHIIVRTFLYMLLYFSTTPAQKYMYCGRTGWWGVVIIAIWRQWPVSGEPGVCPAHQQPLCISFEEWTNGSLETSS